MVLSRNSSSTIQVDISSHLESTSVDTKKVIESSRRQDNKMNGEKDRQHDNKSIVDPDEISHDPYNSLYTFDPDETISLCSLTLTPPLSSDSAKVRDIDNDNAGLSKSERNHKISFQKIKSKRLRKQSLGTMMNTCSNKIQETLPSFLPTSRLATSKNKLKRAVSRSASCSALSPAPLKKGKGRGKVKKATFPQVLKKKAEVIEKEYSNEIIEHEIMEIKMSYAEIRTSHDEHILKTKTISKELEVMVAFKDSLFREKVMMQMQLVRMELLEYHLRQSKKKNALEEPKMRQQIKDTIKESAEIKQHFDQLCYECSKLYTQVDKLMYETQQIQKIRSDLDDYCDHLQNNLDFNKSKSKVSSKKNILSGNPGKGFGKALRRMTPANLGKSLAMFTDT